MEFLIVCIQLSEKQEPTISVSSSESHKKQLKKLRKKFGINAYEEKTANLGAGYTDRAQIRRDTIGSQNANEKTQVASVNE